MAALYAALFCSGAAALVYQSTWGRMLHRVFGVSDLAIATVLATFFLGLGIGSAVGGRYGDRTKNPAYTYAALELAVVFWALASLWLVPRIHDVYAGLAQNLGFGGRTVIRFALAVVILLPPTVFMGATLPMLISAVARRGVVWESSATRLYATNTFGAVLGAAATGLYLVPAFGAQAAIAIAAAASALAAMLVFLPWRGQGTEVDDPLSAADRPVLSRERRRALLFAALLAAGAGFASLAGEVLWTRVLRMVVQGTTQSFAAMLVNFLLGIGLGSILANRLVQRFDARWLFGVTQLLLALLTAGAIWTASQLPRIVMLLQGATIVVPHDWTVVLLASAILLFPIALTLGTSIPLAWRIAGGHADEAAHHGGKILAANTLGGLVGSLLAGFVLVPLLTVEKALYTIALVHVLLASAAFALATRRARARWRAMALVTPFAAAAALFALQPSLHVPYLLDAWYDPTTALIAGPESSWGDTVQYLREGRNTTVTVIDRGDSLRLFNDGRPESGIGGSEPGFGEELVVLGALPSLYARAPRRAMIIGLGAGHSTAVVLGGAFEHVDVVELEDAVVDAARHLYEDSARPFPLDDERAHLVIDDARAQLVLAEPGSYDAIVSQPSHPWLAGSSALYTVEFFQEVNRALADGGVLSLWSNLFRIKVRHLKRIVATLLQVFPEVHAYVAEDSSFILVAGRGPFALDQTFAERAAGEGLRPFLQPFALDDLADFASVLELDTVGARAFTEGAQPLVDDRPALEFELARLPHQSGLTLAQLDYALRELPWLSPQSFEAIPESMRADVLLERIGWVGLRWHQLKRLGRQLSGYALDPEERALVQGALAEELGDVDTAVAHYRRAMPDARAHYRLSHLLEEEQRYEELIAHGRTHGAAFVSGRGLLRAALALDDPSAAAVAIAVSERASDAGDAALLAVLRARVASDCSALTRALQENEPAQAEPTALLLGMECALAKGERSQARAWAKAMARHERARGDEQTKLGQEAVGEGNRGLAYVYFRRALRADGAQAEAASGLARMYADQGNDAAAARVLRSAHREAQGLPNAISTIESQASALNVSLDQPSSN